jgi:hypothetical protein
MAEFVGGRISWVQFKASWMLPGCTSGTAGARWRRGRGAVAQFALDVFNWYLDVFNWYGELVHCVYKSVLRFINLFSGSRLMSSTDTASLFIVFINLFSESLSIKMVPTNSSLLLNYYY